MTNSTLSSNDAGDGRRLPTVSLPVLLFCLATVASSFAVLCWGLNRGFDLNDEGAMLLQCENPDLYQMTYSVQYMLAKLPIIFPSLICDMRAYHLVFASSGAILLWAGVWAFLRNASTVVASGGTRFASLLLLLCLIGNFLEFTTMEYSIGYNTGSAFLLNGSAGLLFCALSNPSSKFRNPLFA